MSADVFFREYGTHVGLGLYFAYHQVWPWLRDRVWPAMAAREIEERAAQARREQDARDEQKARDERLYSLIENSTRVHERVILTLEGIMSLLGTQTASITRINEDLAGLYGHMGHERPSRQPSRKDGT